MARTPCWNIIRRFQFGTAAEEDAFRREDGRNKLLLEMASCSKPLVVTTNVPVSVGTEMAVEQEGIPEMIPPEACYLGWQEILRKLAKLVQPEINQ